MLLDKYNEALDNLIDKVRTTQKDNIINGNTTDQDVIEVIDKLNEIAVSLKEQYK